MPTINWGKAYLRDNPFLGTPPKPGEEMIWAGMTEQRKRIDERISHSIATSPYSLVLNWGPWGGGKTHAARFFNQDQVLTAISKRMKVPKPLSLVVNIPRGAKNVVNELYISIIGSIGLQRIRDDIAKVSANLGDSFADIVRRYSEDEELAAALLLLTGTHGQIPLALKRYFLLSAGTTELRELGLGRNIQTSNDVIKILTSIFNILLESNGGEPVYSEVIIWFDEMEEIISLPGKEQIVLVGLIRDLTDYVPRNLTMFLNFTARSGGKYEDIGAYLSPAVWDRVRDQVFFDYFTQEQIREYILEMLNNLNCRLPDTSKLSTRYVPFDESAVDYLSEALMAKATPRTINEACSIVIERALTSGILDQAGSVIDTEFLKGLDEEIQSITARGSVSRQ